MTGDEMERAIEFLIRDGFNKLILSNEITRDLSNQVARLAIETS